MAGAMLERWLAAGLPPERVTVVRPSGRAVAPGVRVLTALPDRDGDGAGDTGELVMLGVKPAMLDSVAGDVAARLRRGTVLVSILAGIDTAALAARFPGAAVVRAMPNLPVRIGRGVVALHAAGADPALRARIEALMAPLGLAEWIGEERLFDAVTALAGSGPAFLYRFVDALAAGGASLGIDPAQAGRLALATVAGAAAEAARGERPPGEMADRVASKGGSTRAGLDRLDADGALARLVAATLAAAEARNRDMGRELAAAARAAHGGDG